MPTDHPIYTKLRAARNESGYVDRIEAKDCAAIIRGRLRQQWPGVRFSVTTRDGNTINARWTDGPSVAEVDAILSEYTFGGFDGSIDLAYNTRNWLNPDGSMSHAETAGTEGSMGSVPASTGDPADPRALLVYYGPKYAFAHRDLSPELERKLAIAAAKYYGIEYDGVTDPGSVRDDRSGRYLSEIAWRYEQEIEVAQLAE